MIQRCTNANCALYQRYGGRGITVCESWRNYENFLRDMGERPAGLSLDRIDNMGGYTRENCRWATRKQQARNTRSNVYVTIGSETKTQGEWCEVFGISPYTVSKRINRSNWPVQKALTTPVKKGRMT